MSSSMSHLAASPRIDAFLGGRLQLAQATHGHRAGLDAVMLAAAAKVGPGDRVLDAGCGSGVVGVCIAARVQACLITGIDINPQLVEMANDNAARNGFSARYRAVAHDLTGAVAGLQALGVARESFDAIVSNPPFFCDGEGTASSGVLRRQASVMPNGGLEPWLRFMTTMAAADARLAIVHRAAALPKLLAALDRRWGAVHVFPLFARPGAPAHRIIIRAQKGSRAGLTLLPGMVLHTPGNAFTPEAEAVLRHGQPLVIAP